MNYGRFLREIFTTLHSWHSDKVKYEAEGKGDNLPGFRKKWQGAGDKTEIPPTDIMQFEDFSHVLHKWHVRLLKVSSTVCHYFV